MPTPARSCRGPPTSGRRRSASTSAPGRRRTGDGRALYEALFDRLAARGHRTALAVIALPNEASIGLHVALGFELVGTYRRVGWKLGRWHDVAWYQRPLTQDDGPPAPIR